MKEDSNYPYPPENSLHDVMSDIFLFYRNHLRIITAFVVLFFIFGVTLSIVIQPRYASTVTLIATPVDLDIESNTSLPFAGLASLALGDSTQQRTTEALGILESREFAIFFLKEHNLLPQLFPKLWDNNVNSWRKRKNSLLDPIRRVIQGLSNDLGADAFQRDTLEPSAWLIHKIFSEDVLNVSLDRRTGLVRVSIEWGHPIDAATIANQIVVDLNTLMRNRIRSETGNKLAYLTSKVDVETNSDIRIMLYKQVEKEMKKQAFAEVTKDYAFRIIDPAIPTQIRSTPKRLLIIFSALFLGIFSGTMFAFIAPSFWKVFFRRT